MQTTNKLTESVKSDWRTLLSQKPTWTVQEISVANTLAEVKYWVWCTHGWHAMHLCTIYIFRMWRAYILKISQYTSTLTVCAILSPVWGSCLLLWLIGCLGRLYSRPPGLLAKLTSSKMGGPRWTSISTLTNYLIGDQGCINWCCDVTFFWHSDPEWSKVVGNKVWEDGG